jgi:hypothetical protein
MRSIKLWLAPALLAALVLLGAAVAQPPDPKKGPPRGLVQPARISVDDVVERIMAYDKNKDGKVTKDELPERMHGLIARGDTNKDGALDRDEIKKLASTPGGFGPGGFGPGGFGPGGFGPGGFGPGGFGPGGPRPVGLGPVGLGPVDVRIDRRVGPGPRGNLGRAGPGLGDIEGVVDDLKLSNKKKDRALAVVKAHRENVQKLMDQARADMLQKMKEVLSEEELKDFQAALDRPRGATIINVGPPGGR